MAQPLFFVQKGTDWVRASGDQVKAIMKWQSSQSPEYLEYENYWVGPNYLISKKDHTYFSWTVVMVEPDPRYNDWGLFCPDYPTEVEPLFVPEPIQNYPRTAPVIIQPFVRPEEILNHRNVYDIQAQLVRAVLGGKKSLQLVLGQVTPSVQRYLQESGYQVTDRGLVTWS